MADDRASERVEQLIFEQLKRIGDRQESDSGNITQIQLDMGDVKSTLRSHDEHLERLERCVEENEESIEGHGRKLVKHKERLDGMNKISLKAAGGSAGGVAAILAAWEAIKVFLGR